MTEVAATRQPAVARSLTDLWAGAVSALIFYAEYLGLGAALGESFFGRTPTAAATGSLLVLLVVVAGTAMALASGAVFLAGPRGASVAVFGALALWLGALFEASPAQQTAIVALLSFSAAATVGAARHPRLQTALRGAPAWLIQGFLYATAATIVSGAVSGKLYSCLAISETATWPIFAGAVLLGVGWKPALVRAGAGRSALLRKRLRLLHPLGLLVAAAASWWAYEATVLALPHGERCRRLGDSTLDWSRLSDRLHQVGQLFTGVLPPAAMFAALAAGVLLGLVLLIENLTTFEIDRHALTVSDRTRLLDVSAATNFAAALVGASCTSYSTSRTVALRHLGGVGRLALLAHGGTVVAVALYASQWVARAPGLTVAVALTLVAAQMITGDAQKLWRKAYHPHALTPRLLAGTMFWAVLLVSLAANSSLAGFAAGASITLLCAAVARRRIPHGAVA